MAHLPALVAAVIALATLAGVSWPEQRGWAGSAGAVALTIAACAYARAAPRTLLVAALAGAAALATARGGEAFARAARPSLVAALEEAGALDERGPRPPVTLTGTLSADAVVEGPAVFLRLAVTRAAVGPCACPLPVAGDVLVAVAGALAPGQAGQWRAGRAVTVSGSVRRPVSYRNLGAPDAPHDLVRRRLALMAGVKSAALVEGLRLGPWPAELAAAIRARARTAIARAAGPNASEAAAIGTAVLIGDRAGLGPDLTARLQRAGTFHVIAISGGNIALFAWLALTVTTRVAGPGRAALVVTALALLGYAGVVGGGASVLRATGMAVVGLALRTLDQRSAALNVLALTAAALLVADPLLAVDTGFWLTTAATAGLVVGLDGAAGTAARWRRLGRALVLTSIWAELALLPIVAAVFQQVTVAGVFLSAFAIPGMALVQVAAMAAALADTALPWLLPWAGLALRTGAAVVTESARAVDWLPFLTWRVPPPAFASIALYYVALLTWVWARVAGAGAGRARLRRPALATVAVLGVWLAVAPSSLVSRSRPFVEVATLDVGQGDAIAVRFPDGRTMLVDAGGRPVPSRFDIGSRVVGPALRARGIRRLDYLVITHGDADHVGGAESLVREFRPAEVWTGVPVAGDGATAALRRAAAAVGAAWRVVRRGDLVTIGGVDVHTLHPPPPDWERQRVRNDDSVVLALAYGRVQVLLTGDIGAAVEAEVADVALGRHQSETLPWIALKVAHHGSAGSTSPALLDRLAPRVAIVSAGVDDPFGHPAPATLERLAAAGADIWRTDREGEITLRSDGVTVALSAFSGRRRGWTAADPPATARQPRP